MDCKPAVHRGQSDAFASRSAVHREVPGLNGTSRFSPGPPPCRVAPPGMPGGLVPGAHHRASAACVTAAPDDVGDMPIDQAITHFAPHAIAGHHAGRLQHAQVLADQGLRDQGCRPVRGHTAKTRATARRWRSNRC